MSRIVTRLAPEKTKAMGRKGKWCFWALLTPACSALTQACVEPRALLEAASEAVELLSGTLDSLERQVSDVRGQLGKARDYMYTRQLQLNACIMTPPGVTPGPADQYRDATTKSQLRLVHGNSNREHSPKSIRRA